MEGAELVSGVKETRAWAGLHLCLCLHPYCFSLCFGRWLCAPTSSSREDTVWVPSRQLRP